MFSFAHSIMESLKSVWNDLFTALPQIIAAITVVIAGLFISFALKKLTLLILKWIKIDRKMHDIWIFRFRTRDTKHHLPSRALSNFVYYIVIFISVLVAVKILGGKTGEMILSSLFGIIPGVLSFMLILFLGFLLAVFLSFIAQIIFVTLDFRYPSFWGKVVAWSTFSVVAVFSLEQLGIAGKLLSFLFILTLSIAGVTIALAFGIGCRDLAREFVTELLKKNKQGKNQ
jgi:hypothetical protein